MIEVLDLFDDRTGQVWESSRGIFLIVRPPAWSFEASDQVAHEALNLKTGETCGLLETVDEPWEDLAMRRVS